MKENPLFTSTNPLKVSIIFFIISTLFILSMMQLSKRLYIYLSIDNFAIYSIVLTTLFTSVILFFLISKTINAFSVKNKAILDKNLELEATYSQLLATEDALHQTIDDLLAKEEALLRSESTHKLILEGSKDAIWEWDFVNNKMYLDKSWELLGYSLDDCESSLESWRSLVHPEDLSRLINSSNDYLNRKTDLYHVKYRIKTKNGDYIWILNRAQATWDDQGNPLRIAGTHTNINDDVKNQEKIYQLAYIDTLTGLPNKNSFCEFLHDALAKEKNSNSNFSLLLVDLDGFKLINDSLGHSIGDMILQNISALIASAIANIEDCFMARFGGDEFIVFIPNNHNKENVFNIAKRILNQFSTTISLSGYDFHITASIGIANYPEHGTTAEVLVQAVEAAMYSAKESGRNKYIQYNPTINKTNKRKFEIKNELQQALSNDELILHYQPIVDSNTGNVIAAEALLRWMHPTRGLVPPNHFIAIAEETGQIIEIGEWVIKTALKQCIEWKTKGIKHIKMHINLSVKQLHHQNLFSFLKKTIDDLGMNAKCIVLEITESIATNSLDEAIIAIEELKSLGVSVALDDFGTGYSSLSYTSKLPFDELKIDKSFIDNILNYEADYYISKFIIELCNARNILTTAEGVETVQQKNALNKLGCNNIQGYYFSKPLSSKDFEDYLNK